MLDNDGLVLWWKGYVQVEISGRYVERLLNQMVSRQFTLWDVIRLEGERTRLCMEAADFKRLPLLLKETGCRVKILKKAGLPFEIKRMTHQAGFYVGTFLFVVLLYLSSSLIWSVEIEGISHPEQQASVKELLAELGVKRWAFKSSVPGPAEIKREIMDHFEEVSWAGFQFNGTTAQLKVVLKTIPEEPEPVPDIDLVAKKKAVVRDLLVESGKARVKPQQLVKPGDVLVSGDLGIEEHKRVPVKAQVWGEVWYISHITVPFEQQHTVLSGEQHKQYYIHFGPYRIKVWGFDKTDFNNVIRTEETKTFSLFSYELPVKLTHEKVMEAERVTVKLKEEEAVKQALEWSRERLLAQLDDEAVIVDENILKKQVDSGKVYIKMHYSVIEEITSRNYASQGE